MVNHRFRFLRLFIFRVINFIRLGNLFDLVCAASEANEAWVKQPNVELDRLGRVALDGMIMVANGDRQVGVERIHQAITEFKKMRGGTALPWMLSAVAEAHNRNGSPEKAQAVVDTALSFVEKEGERHWEAELYRIKGEAKLAHGDIDEAEALFRQAINVAERQKALSLELRATMSLARLQMRTDKFQARNLVAAVYSRFTEGFATADLIAAKSLLDQLKSASSNIELLGGSTACE